MHTASPLAGSTSIDVEPQEEHLVAPFDDASADPPDAPVAAEAAELPVVRFNRRFRLRFGLKNGLRFLFVAVTQSMV